MEPIKHTINISQVCREAIETYVEDFERARDRLEADHLDQAVDRLSDEEEQLEVDWEELAWIDAKEWVEMVDIENWDHLFHRVDILKKQGRPTWMVPPPAVPGDTTFEDRFLEHERYFERQYKRLFDLNEEGDPRQDAEEKYGRAWLAYVCAVRAKIQQLREERFRAKFKSPIVRAEPEVPEHLMP